MKLFFIYDKDYSYHKCPNCNFVKRSPEDAKIDYVNEYMNSNAINRSKILAKNYYRKLKNYFSSEQKVLEIGGSLGFFGKILSDEKKCDVYNYELSKYALDYSKKINNVVPITDIDQKKYNGMFDVICAFHVIEHIEPNEFNKFIATIKQKLKKDGLIIILTPNGHSSKMNLFKKLYPCICFPDHISFFSQRSAKILLENHTFEIIDSETRILSYIHYPLISPSFLATYLLRSKKNNLIEMARKKPISKKENTCINIIKKITFAERICLLPLHYLVDLFTSQKDELLVVAKNNIKGII